MSKYIFILFLFPTILTTNIVSAQTVFVEGVIKYTIAIKDNANITQSKGSYTIYIKDGLIRKEMKFNDGYENTMLINSNSKTIYSLYTSEQNHFAVQLDYETYFKNVEPYKNYVLINSDESKMIANFNAKKYEVKYKNEPSTFIYYSEQLQLEGSNIFERFPRLKYVPLSFEIKTDDGINMLLEADNIEIKPVPSSLFMLPAGYKIISAAEFSKIKD